MFKDEEAERQRIEKEKPRDTFEFKVQQKL
jgi:hypothetical protein